MDKIRIRITQKCQYKCFYCTKQTGKEDLSWPLLAGVVETAAGFGVHAVEICGGEPLMVQDPELLVEKLRRIQGIDRIYLTTNGILLPEKINALKAVGIDGINIHCDTINASDLTEITGTEGLMNGILNGIWQTAAQKVPLAVSVPVHDISLRQLFPMVSLAKKLSLTVRLCFIKGLSDHIDPVEIAVKLKRRYGGENYVEHVIRPEGWKGGYCFASTIEGAFHMEDAAEFSI